jgi:hypothetical protein
LDCFSGVAIIPTMEEQPEEVHMEAILSNGSVRHFPEVLGLFAKIGQSSRLRLGITSLSGADGTVFEGLARMRQRTGHRSQWRRRKILIFESPRMPLYRVHGRHQMALISGRCEEQSWKFCPVGGSGLTDTRVGPAGFLLHRRSPRVG